MIGDGVADKEVVLNNEKKTINYIDTLAFAIYWNNLSSVSSKYKFVFDCDTNF